MKALVQRVSSASVAKGGSVVSKIDQGLLILLGVFPADSEQTVLTLAKKILALRIFSGDNKDMNRSVTDVGGEILLVSQFTLCARTNKGNRPSFVDAAPPEHANKLYELMKTELNKVAPVQTGVFGQYMQVSLVNDGPVTIMLEE